MKQEPSFSRVEKSPKSGESEEGQLASTSGIAVLDRHFFKFWRRSCLHYFGAVLFLMRYSEGGKPKLEETYGIGSLYSELLPLPPPQ